MDIHISSNSCSSNNRSEREREREREYASLPSHIACDAIPFFDDEFPIHAMHAKSVVRR